MNWKSDPYRPIAVGASFQRLIDALVTRAEWAEPSADWWVGWRRHVPPRRQVSADVRHVGRFLRSRCVLSPATVCLNSRQIPGPIAVNLP